MNLFLDEQRRGGHDQVGPVLHVLAVPHKLGVEVGVAALVGDLDSRTVAFGHDGLVLGCRDVLAGRLVVGEGLDLLAGPCCHLV